VTEVVFLVVVNGLEERFVVTTTFVYQFVKGLIVGIFIFVGSNVGRVLWARAYGRITCDPNGAGPPAWFSCWQDYAMAATTLVLLGLTIGLGFLAKSDFRTRTGRDERVPAAVTTALVTHLAIGLVVAAVVQLVFMFVLGCIPPSWIARVRARALRCLPCARKPTPATAATSTTTTTTPDLELASMGTVSGTATAAAAVASAAPLL
jgi:hypothetical protein